MEVHRFFSGLTLEEGMHIPRHYEADYVLVHTNSPLDRELHHLPGFVRLDTPGERYSLLAVDRESLPGTPHKTCWSRMGRSVSMRLVVATLEGDVEPTLRL